MLVNVSTQGFSVTPAMDAHARTHLADALGKFASSVISVDVHLRDTNGPKGGIDKSALFAIRLSDVPTVVIESTHADLYAAVRLSARRARRAVRRALARHRRMRRRELRQLRMSQDLFDAI